MASVGIDSKSADPSLSLFVVAYENIYVLIKIDSFKMII